MSSRQTSVKKLTELLWLLSLRRACEISRVLADGLARFAGGRE